MPKFIIERPLPGAGALDDDEIRAISARSNTVLAALGDVQWLESHVTTDKLYCLYVAPHEAGVREHAERGGFPLGAISVVTRTIDPTTGGL